MEKKNNKNKKTEMYYVKTINSSTLALADFGSTFRKCLILKVPKFTSAKFQKCFVQAGSYWELKDK